MKKELFIIILLSVIGISGKMSAENIINDPQPERKHYKLIYILDVFHRTTQELHSNRVETANYMVLSEEEAYLRAYEEMCIRALVTFCQRQRGEVLAEVKCVILADVNSRNILPDINFPDREKKEKDIWNLTLKDFENRACEFTKEQKETRPNLKKASAKTLDF